MGPLALLLPLLGLGAGAAGGAMSLAGRAGGGALGGVAGGLMKGLTGSLMGGPAQSGGGSLPMISDASFSGGGGGGKGPNPGALVGAAGGAAGAALGGLASAVASIGSMNGILIAIKKDTGAMVGLLGNMAPKAYEQAQGAVTGDDLTTAQKMGRAGNRGAKFVRRRPVASAAGLLGAAGLGTMIAGALAGAMEQAKDAAAEAAKPVIDFWEGEFLKGGPFEFLTEPVDDLIGRLWRGETVDGDSFLPDWLLTPVDELVMQGVDVVGENIKKGWEEAGKLADGAWSGIVGFVTDPDGLGPITTLIGDNLQGAYTSATGFINEKFGKISDWFTTNGIGWQDLMADPVGTISKGFELAGQGIEDAYGTIHGYFTDPEGGFQKFMDNPIGTITTGMKDAGAWIGTKFGEVSNFFTNPDGGFQTFMNDPIKGIESAYADVSTTIGPLLAGAADLVSTNFKKGLTWASDAADETNAALVSMGIDIPLLAGAAADFLSPAFNKAVGWASDGASTVNVALQKMGIDIPGFFESVPETLGGLFGGVVKFISPGEGGKSPFMSMMGNLGPTVQAKFEGVKDNLLETFSDVSTMFSSWGDFMGGVFGDIGGFLGGAADTVVDVAKDAGEAIGDAANSAVEGVADAGSWLGRQLGFGGEDDPMDAIEGMGGMYDIPAGRTAEGEAIAIGASPESQGSIDRATTSLDDNNRMLASYIAETLGVSLDSVVKKMMDGMALNMGGTAGAGDDAWQKAAGGSKAPVTINAPSGFASHLMQWRSTHRPQ